LSGETEPVGDIDALLLRLIVTLTVFVTPVGKVVGLAVKVFTDDPDDVTEGERLVLEVGDGELLIDDVLELVLLPVNVCVYTLVTV
jgi:hypothetical protein